MNDRKTDIRMKFCEALDRFVKIRKFSPQEIEELFKGVQITDQRSYKRLVINAAVVNFLDEIAPVAFGNDEQGLLNEVIEQELYKLCIKVNPALDIREITIPVTEEQPKEERKIPLLTAGEGEGARQLVLADEKLLHMEEALKKRVLGQDNAIKTVSQVIRMAHVGLRNPRRPIGTFIFVGQTGVGKTELAKALTEFLFGSEDKLIRVDCSEYALGHEYAKLIGAPPGYIGHNEGGYLTEAVRNNPRSVVVFDEIEKAHKKVHNLLLQIMDEGTLTDNKGNHVSFRDTVVVMTSNTGMEEIDKLEKSIGFSDGEKELSEKDRALYTRKALEKLFPPEFLNRVDEIVVFRKLTREDNIRIIELMLAEVEERLEKLGLTIEFTRKAKDFLVEVGTNEKYGARPLRRAIHRYVENPLAELILEGRLRRGDHLKATRKKGQDTLHFSIEEGDAGNE